MSGGGRESLVGSMGGHWLLICDTHTDWSCETLLVRVRCVCCVCVCAQRVLTATQHPWCPNTHIIFRVPSVLVFLIDRLGGKICLNFNHTHTHTLLLKQWGLFIWLLCWLFFTPCYELFLLCMNVNPRLSILLCFLVYFCFFGGSINK